ncbi:efflux RND transporter periplasmic adaptor subunit [Aquiflexum gelatinilyticum]|uniref:Efflux RND transporter periplasmic adaptor subunit n=1 Tax=Aquiflexum gelatinilyticum TaxID=2961943 RepID=A0A9X2P157_9BACT|nr:efflux RND transporter periplasmic adaptor subunit [Aquiflexum gelatinilyticum]MCR9013434.1 efflux RND transporter periplasmic adaptor subunit [Aquiflexum gelatinilyticum]
MKNQIYIVLLSAVMTWMFSACGAEKDQSIVIPEEKELNEIIISKAQFEKGQMALDSLTVHTFSDFILTNGMVNIPAEGRFDVSSYFGGNIVRFDLLIGQKIQKGQVLFTIENPEFVQMQQDYLDAMSQLTYLKSDYERQKTLNAENISSQKNFAKAESDYKSTLAKTESLRKMLQLVNISSTQLDASKITSKANIYAPISGYIESIKVNQGTYLNPSDIALTIINKDHLHIELNVFEQDAIALEIGQEVTFYLPDNKSREFKGKIFLIGQSINEKRMLNIHVHLDNEKEGDLLVPGMFIEAKIAVKSSKNTALPIAAVINSDEVNYVLAMTQTENDLYYFKKTKVEIGLQDDQMVEVKPEISFKPGTIFLSKGGFQLIK